MSLEEKNSWVYLALAIVLPLVYLSSVLPELSIAKVEEIDYAGRLLAAIGAAIVISIIANIVLTISSGRKPQPLDERDRSIAARSDLVGYWVLSAGVVGVLFMVFARVDQFWIGNGIYAAFIISAVVSSIIKLVAYRRGF